MNTIKEKKLKSLLIGIGPGYHWQVRSMHAMVKNKCDSSMLFFNIDRKIDSIGDNLRLHSSLKYSSFASTFSTFKEWVKESQFNLIGIGFMSHHWDIYVEMSKIIRHVLPNCKIICGGVHAWHIDSYLTLEHCDYVCAGEGEELYSKLVDKLSSDANASGLRIPGLTERYQGEVIHTHVQKYMPIDDTPFPTYGDKKTYTITAVNIDKPFFLNEDPLVRSEFGYIHVGRGCFFKCSFCINAVIENKTVRLRSVNKVIAEIKEMLSVCKNVRAIIFNDEIFPVRHSWLPEFCKKYKEQINLPFQIVLYPHMLSEEKIRILKSAGLTEIAMGLQSGSERIRNHIYDRHDKNSRLLTENALLGKHNIMTSYDIIIRNPYETETDLSIGLDFIHKLEQPYYLKFYTLAYYPKHPITIRALKEKMVDPKEVDATIGYLDVRPPHKIRLREHYHDDATFVAWHKRIRKLMLKNYKENAYYLMMCYHGVWFIPQFVLNFLIKQFKKDNLWQLYVFSYLLEGILIVRNFYVVRYPFFILLKLKQNGLIFVTKLVIKKLMHIFRQISYKS